MNVPSWLVTTAAICIVCFVLGILSGCAQTPNAKSGTGAGYILKCGDKTIEVASQRDIDEAIIVAEAGDCRVEATIKNASSKSTTEAIARTAEKLVDKLP